MKTKGLPLETEDFKNIFNEHVICNIVTCDKYKSW